MKFQISLPKQVSHKDSVTCISWSTTEEVFSAGDDHLLLSWNISSNEFTVAAQMNSDLFPTDLQFLPKTGGSLIKRSDLLLVTSADGKFHIMNRSGRIERTVEAHKGAILSGQWANDGASLLTAGEDGLIKVWSRGGMLRSVVADSENPVYGVCWSPDSQSIGYTQGNLVIIKHLTPNTKPLQWRAHEGTVLCLAWSAANDLLISGGEDCRYRVWDSQGRQLFSSNSHDSFITSLAWSPAGDLFAVGSYNTLRLCDYLGWSRSLEKPDTGSIYKLSWSGDSTQIAGACANNKVLFAHVIERNVTYLNFSATVTERKTITVSDVTNETTESLEFPERVIQLALRYSHLVATTPTQCFVYNTSNWNTPTIFDLKDGSVNLLLLTEKHFLIVEKSSVSLYNYQGRLIASPRWPNMRVESLRSAHVSLSNDALVVRDALDEKTAHILDLASTKSASESTVTIQHKLPIVQIALDQSGAQSKRTMAVLDKTHDLYVVQIKSPYRLFLKLGNQVQSFRWDSQENILAAIQDTRLVVWFCPAAAPLGGTLLRLCSFYDDSPDLGKSPRIHDFVSSSVAVRRADGSLVNIMTAPFPALLHKYVNENKWKEALNLCRTMGDGTLWCCLAVLATQSGVDTLDVAEEAFAAINCFDKVFYIQHLKTLPTRVQQMAGAALLSGAPYTAEVMLLHNGMVYQAICINLQLHNWNRALKIAVKYKSHIDTILYKRQRYLETLDKDESNKKFLAVKDSVTVDEESVKKAIEAEIQKHGEI